MSTYKRNDNRKTRKKWAFNNSMEQRDSITIMGYERDDLLRQNNLNQKKHKLYE